MQTLTDYETAQVHEIAGWKAEPPLLMAEATDAMLSPIVKMVEQFVPEQSVRDAIKAAYDDAEIFAHRQEVAERAQVDDVHELRKVDLAVCDRLADVLSQDCASKAAVRSVAAVGAGPILNMEVSMMLMLKTAHMIAFCYGFTPEDDKEKTYILQTMLLASASTLKEKRDAIVNLHTLEDEMVGDVVEDALEDELETLTDFAIEQVIGTVIPMVGLVLQGVTNANLTFHTAQVAKRVFQERWLRANGKVTRIAPDPQYAHSRLQLAEAALAGWFYWPSYFISFAVSFPTLLVASFLPSEHIAVQGLADGGKAADEDLHKLKQRLRRTVESGGEQAVPDTVATATAPA